MQTLGPSGTTLALGKSPLFWISSQLHEQNPRMIPEWIFWGTALASRVVVGGLLLQEGTSHTAPCSPLVTSGKPLNFTFLVGSSQCLDTLRLRDKTGTQPALAPLMK